MTHKVFLTVILASAVSGLPGPLAARLPPGYTSALADSGAGLPSATYSSPDPPAPTYRASSRGSARPLAGSSHVDNAYDDALDQRPAQYNFQYDAQDAYTGKNFGHEETREGYNTQGSYYVPLPDGRVQKVTYYVNGDSGFVAEITFEGEATYPEFQYSDESSSHRPTAGPSHRSSYRPTPAPTYVPTTGPSYGSTSSPSYQPAPARRYQPTPGPSYEPPEEYVQSASYEVASTYEAAPSNESAPSEGDQPLSSDHQEEDIYT
ncbi:uncharacterized protein [Panulirus ornatus]|uniref:uncharacterized protein n=1 Tax=Panulirus ornatus TaxID=150431 RepID=UPI003A85E3FD